MSFMRSAIYALTFLFLLSFSFNLVSAQSTTATLSGTVVDKNETPIAGASVSLTRNGGSFAYVAMSGPDGMYKFESLPPGNYSAVVRREGFAATDVPEITVTAGVNDPIGFELVIPNSAEISVGKTLSRMEVHSNLAFGMKVDAQISVTVTDEQGIAIPKARIVIQNAERSFRREGSAAEDGTLVLSSVPAGTYSVTVRHDGFAAVEVADIILNAGDSKALSLQLRVGDVSGDDLSPYNSYSLTNTESSVSTSIVRTSRSKDLPFNGRSFSSLILLTPGTTITNSNASGAGQFGTNGLRASTNRFSIDGADVNFGMSTDIAGSTNMALAGAYPASMVFGGLNNLATLDSVEELKLQTANYEAEFGGQMGAQLSLSTKSGTNHFHGSLYEYFRNDALEARNYFNKRPAAQTPLKHHLFGGTIGGPVYFPNLLPSDKSEVPGGKKRSGIYNGKDRTFFFAAYEGVRMRQPASGMQFVPSMQARAFASSVFRPLLNAFPIPNGPALGMPGQPFGWAFYTYSLSHPGKADTISVRLDHKINNNNQVMARIVDSRSEVSSGSFTTATDKAKTNMVALGVTSLITSKMANEFRFNYGKQSAIRIFGHNPIDGAVAFDRNLLTNGFIGEGAIDFVFGGSSNGLRTGTFADNAQQQLVVSDTVSYALSTHTLKFGVNFRRLNPHYRVQDQQAALVNQLGIINSVVNLLAVSAIMPVRPRYENFSAFAQDSWKLTKRLTLDYGLRWDVNPAPTEADDILTPVIAGIVGADVSNARLEPFGTKYYDTDYTAFAPRFGAAYHLFRKNGWDTIVRGGFGVFHDMGSGTAGNGSPFGLTSLRSNVPFPVSATNATRPPLSSQIALPFSGTLYTTDPNLKLPYALHWNVGIEQELDRAQVVNLAYVGTAGRKLLVTQNLNSSAFGPRPNPNFGPIVYSTNGAESDYHSLQAHYRVRLRDRMEARANYTWSHAIDTASNDIFPGVLDRGNADFDVRHNFSAAVTYDLPSLNEGRAIKYLTKDWYLSSIVHVQSGRPIDINSGAVIVDGRLVNRRPDYVAGEELYIDEPLAPGGRRFNAAAFTVGPPGQQGTLGRNVLRELPVYQFDVAVGRNFNFTEDVRLTLKAEAFNVLNHPMFGGYGTNIQSPSTLGIPTQTLNASLGGLNPIYQIGGPRAVQLAAKLSF